MSKSKKSIAIFLSLVFLLAAVMPTMTYASSETDYKITNPYADINWYADGRIHYKANLHCHSYASDGKYDVDEIIEEHYALKYDALALTDHGIVNSSWTEPYSSEDNRLKQLYIKATSYIGSIQSERGDYTKPTYLTPERYEQIINGTDRNGQGMLAVPYSNEQNPISTSHVNTWFTDYSNGPVGLSDYDTPIRMAEEKGGLSVINHPGRYTLRELNEDYPERAYTYNNSYFVNKLANILIKYNSCIGIDVNSKTDGTTRNDRVLWDKLLQKVVPTGRNVFGICSGDTHKKSALDSGWIIYCTNDGNTLESLRNCLETGAFFGGSRHIKNKAELEILEAETGKTLGKDGEWMAPDTIPQPIVKNILVDEKEDTISISADNALTIHWIADGKVIAVGDTIDLDDYSDKIGSYVRAEIFGDGGILYSQPFTLEYEGAPEAENTSFIDLNVLLKDTFNLIIEVGKILLGI